jgi:A/G-specific adenine glycosylase
MLQQTRITAAIPYYERFLARFPSFESLAAACETDLLAHWAGLGYYYRARNLQKAAQAMVRAGKFPETYEEIRELAGVGDYTAAAVASIAFGLPHAVVDGNVFRVLSRVSNDSTDILSSGGKRRFAATAQALLPDDSPGDYNQALMELGATVCLPKNPQCLVCPVADVCAAREEGRQHELPVKNKAQRSAVEDRTLYWIEWGQQLLVWQRPPDSRLMPGFWELPESEQIGTPDRTDALGSFRHTITFHKYRFRVMSASPPPVLGRCQWRSFAELSLLPISTIFKKAQRIVSKHPRAAVATGA